jgi:hypothetical protein
VEGRKAAAEKRREFAKRLAACKAEPPTKPEEVVDHLVEEFDAILLEPATELDHNRAPEVGIEYLEKYDGDSKTQQRSRATGKASAGVCARSPTCWSSKSCRKAAASAD